MRAGPRRGHGTASGALDSWVDRVRDAYGDEDVFVYFNNDHGGAAVVDAAAFAERARGRGLAVTRTSA